MKKEETIITLANGGMHNQKAYRKMKDMLNNNCLDSWDHVPIRSWPLFKARNVLRTLFQSDFSLATR